MIKRPGQTTGGVVGAQVSHLDIAATVGHLLGASWTIGGPGGSVFSAPESRPLVLVENAGRYPEKYRGVRGSDFKFLTSRAGVEELYDLGADPGELENLAPAWPEQLAELRQVHTRTRTASRSERTEPEPALEDDEVDAQAREQLKALGYLE